MLCADIYKCFFPGWGLGVGVARVAYFMAGVEVCKNISYSLPIGVMSWDWVWCGVVWIGLICLPMCCRRGEGQERCSRSRS